MRPTHNKRADRAGRAGTKTRKSTLYTAGYDGTPDAAVQHAPCAKIVSNKNRLKKFLLKLIFV
jgi:hypothetical protein